MATKVKTKDFKDKVYDKVEKEYTVLGEYKNTKTKILMRHNSEVCNNHEYLVQPSSFLTGNRCPKCNNKRKGKKPKTTEQFKKELYDKVGDEYTLIGEYNGAMTKLNLKHTCGKIWKVTPNAFFSKGNRCFYCRMREHNKNQRKTHEKFVEEVKERYEDRYNILSEYTFSNDKILVEHICGTKWYVKARHLLSNEVCPHCKKSIGERHVEDYLKNNNIKYETQKTFDGLVYKRNLSYDFYLPEYNILIEYQGLQHYRPIENFNGEEGFRQQKEKDKLKYEYAIKNGFKLIEVDYNKKRYNAISKYLDEQIISVK